MFQARKARQHELSASACVRLALFDAKGRPQSRRGPRRKRERWKRGCGERNLLKVSSLLALLTKPSSYPLDTPQNPVPKKQPRQEIGRQVGKNELTGSGDIWHRNGNLSTSAAAGVNRMSWPDGYPALGQFRRGLARVAGHCYILPAGLDVMAAFTLPEQEII